MGAFIEPVPEHNTLTARLGMAHTYTPGLTVTDQTVVRKKRLLPLPGTVLVEQGQTVDSATVVARTKLPGKMHIVNVVNQLGIVPTDIRDFMRKHEGDAVERGEVIAEDNPFIAWFKTRVESPISGSLESISDLTGQVLVREKPEPLDVTAYVDGTVQQILAGEGVVVETTCSMVQGIFGVGGEACGPLVRAAETPDETLHPAHITSEMQGTIVFGGAYAGWDVLQAARTRGVKGMIVGGINAQDLSALLGYDLGVAITGTEMIGLTLIVTEGFGAIAMASRTFSLLSRHIGKKASVSGATQIRAGVVRPEIIIPLQESADDVPSTDGRTAKARQGIAVGDPVRVIREPYFGRIGKVASLPAGLQSIPTESTVRVIEIELPDATRMIVPRANVEIIEG